MTHSVPNFVEVSLGAQRKCYVRRCAINAITMQLVHGICEYWKKMLLLRASDMTAVLTRNTFLIV